MAFEVKLDIKGTEEFQAKIRSLDSAIQKHVHRKLVSLGADISAEAKRLAPMRTGRLRSSIFSRVRQWILTVGVTASYAWFVEFGTRYMAARKFLWHAIQRYLPQLNTIMGEAIGQAIEEARRT
jgi:HK97 gp10 family phage protein